MTDKMKLCPFCGGTAKELAEGYVSCFSHDCPMSAMSMTVEAWNRRAKDAKVDEAKYYQGCESLSKKYFTEVTNGIITDAIGWCAGIGRVWAGTGHRQEKAWDEITCAEYEQAKLAAVKPERVKEIEPWIIGWMTCRWEECVEQLQLRLEAVENEMRKR